MNGNEKQKSVVSRRLVDDTLNDQAIRSHARLAGEVVWAWNELHSAFNMLFIGLVDPDNPLMGMKLWTAIANETAQREMLREAAECSRGLTNAVRDRVHWSIKQADKLAVYRNDIVHGHMGFTLGEGGVTTSISYLGNSFSRIVRHGQVDLPLGTLMAALRGDLMALAGYTAGLSRSSLQTKLGPPRFMRPRRPRLKTFKLIEAGKQRARELADEWGD